VLIANGMRIVHLGGLYKACYDKSPPGLYSSIDEKIKYIEYVSIPDTLVRPQFDNGSISMGKYYEDGLNKVVKSPCTFARVYLDKRLTKYAGSVGFLPTASADVMQIIIASGVNKTYKLDLHVKRCCMAISARNRFNHCRKSFCTMDIMGDFVQWDTPIRYPSIKVADEKTVLDLTLSSEMPEIRVIPLAINPEDFVNTVDYAQADEMTAQEFLLLLITEGPPDRIEYVLRVLACFHLDGSVDSFAKVGRNERYWPSECDQLFDMSEDDLKCVLRREHPQLLSNYTAYLGEYAAADGDRDDDEGESPDDEDDDTTIRDAEEMDGNGFFSFNLATAPRRKE